jgi:hypothetical protein
MDMTSQQSGFGQKPEESTKHPPIERRVNSSERICTLQYFFFYGLTHTKAQNQMPTLFFSHSKVSSRQIRFV